MKNMNRQRIGEMLEGVKEKVKERVRDGKRIPSLFRKKTGVPFILFFLLFSFFIGFLGGFSAIAVSRTFSSPPKIASINMKKIISSYIDQNVRQTSLSNQELSNRSKQFIQILESEVRRFSKENNTVLLLSDVMVSGNQEVTPLIKERVNKQFLVLIQSKTKHKKSEKQDYKSKNQEGRIKEVDYDQYS